jgi:hypothetical protein
MNQTILMVMQYEVLTAVKTSKVVFWVTSTFSPEEGRSMFLRNVDICLQVHMVLQPRRQGILLHEYRRIKQREREADHSQPSNIKVFNGLRCTSPSAALAKGELYLYWNTTKLSVKNHGEKSTAVWKHCHKYYPIRPKIP